MYYICNYYIPILQMYFAPTSSDRVETIIPPILIELPIYMSLGHFILRLISCNKLINIINYQALIFVLYILYFL